MNFDRAIALHTAWKKELKAYLVKGDSSLESSEFGYDDNCPLGQLIHDQEERYSLCTEFAALKASHAHFHQVAAGLVMRSHQDPSVVEEMELGAHSEFTAATSTLVRAIITLRKRLAK